MTEIVPHPLQLTGPNGCAFQTEVYLHTLPLVAGQRLFFAVPYVQHKVFGNECHSRWVCRHYQQWVNLLRSASHVMYRSGCSLTSTILARLFGEQYRSEAFMSVGQGIGRFDPQTNQHPIPDLIIRSECISGVIASM